MKNPSGVLNFFKYYGLRWTRNLRNECILSGICSTVLCLLLFPARMLTRETYVICFGSHVDKETLRCL